MVVKRKKPNSTSADKDVVREVDDPLNVVSGFVGDDYHKLLNDRVRLGLMSGLAVSNQMSFKHLKGLLEVSDGNLSTHARKLEDAGFVTVHKSFEGRFPKTEFSITQSGRSALQRYLEHMEALLKATHQI